MRRDAGFGSLIEMLLVLCCMLILLACLLPNMIRANQVGDELAASTWLSQISGAELTFAQEFGVYVEPNQLTGTLGSTNPAPGTCANPMLLPGYGVPFASMAPSGYAVTWTAGASTTSSNSGCSAVTGQLSTWSINLDPANRLAGQRHFYLNQSGVIRSNNTTTASASDPIYAVPTQVSTLLVASGLNQSNNAPTTPSPVPPGGQYAVSITLLVQGGGVLNGPWSGGTFTINPETLNLTSGSIPGCGNFSGSFNSGASVNASSSNCVPSGSYSGVAVFAPNGTFTFLSQPNSNSYGIEIQGTQSGNPENSY